MLVLEAFGLVKTYGRRRVVDGVDFAVEEGEIVGLLGPNGAGKSTTIGMLTTAIVPTAGSARVAGFDVAGEPRSARRASSVVFQDAVVDRGLSGRRNLDIHARLWGVAAAVAAERIRELATDLGLAALLDRPVAGYSGGERRRLEIARALVSRPQVLFLDEPTVGLDPRIRHELLEVIGRLRDRGQTTILLTTHYLDEAERLCDRIAIVHAGRIVAADTPEALRAALGHELVELRLTSDPAPALASLRERGIAGDDAFTVGSTVTVPVHAGSATRVLELIHRAELAVSAVSTRRPTLDDVYLQLTGARIADAA